MRNLFLGLFLLMGTLMVVVACQKETAEEAVVDGVEQRDARAGFRERYFLYVTWDRFGRTKKPDCAGIGLCNVYSCVNCCIVNGVRVDCDDDPDALVIHNAGVITEANGALTLTIELSPNHTEQASVIQNENVFYVDDDLSVGDYIIKAGQYPYLSSVGTHGGYLINVEGE